MKMGDVRVLIHAWRGSYLLPIWHLGGREPGVGDRVDPGLATEK